MYDIEKIVEAKNINDALEFLNQNPDAVIISGGSDILIKIREGKLAGSTLLSIHNIKELKEISKDSEGTIKIGAAVSFKNVTYNSIIKECVPTLGYACDQAGGPQLRNVGTIGGNVCNGVTSADSASTLLTLNAVLEIVSIKGVRYMPLEKFYKGPGLVNLEKGEILKSILIYKKDYENFGGHYIKYAMRSAMDIATLGCAVHVKLDENKENIIDLKLAFGVAAPTPIRCYETEKNIIGTKITTEIFETVGKIALTEVNPRTSWRASKEFREQLVYELSGRALKKAILNAGGSEF